MPSINPSQFSEELTKIKPDYYHGNRVAEFWDEFCMDPYQAMITKYVARAGMKPGSSYQEDMKKIIEYAQMAIESDKKREADDR